MSRILLYEFITAGGLLGQDESAELASLHREGQAMLSALAADFAVLAGVETLVVLAEESSDVHLPGCQVVPVRGAGGDLAALEEASPQVDWTIVIAPEFDELLESRLELVAAAGGRALASPLDLVALLADKQRTAEHLMAAGIPAPQGILTGLANPLPGDFAYPAVFKPRFGAGSQDVWLIPDAAVATQVRGSLERPGRLEQFCTGTPASVAILCGPAAHLPLLPCAQRLSADGRFRYLGGHCPLDAALANRAERLSLRAVNTLPDPLGYIGIDLVLGADPSGNDDRVIEINPRLTTSYVGLRAVSAVNLAGAMLDVAEGRSTRLSWLDRWVEFDCTGEVCDSPVHIPPTL